MTTIGDQEVLVALLKRHETLGSLRVVLEDFYNRVFADTMIGFYFAGRDKARLVEKELELTLNALGGPVSYSGRPLTEVHRPLRIAGGHFDRRLQILKEAMAAHDLPIEIRNAWIEHTVKLRSLITGDSTGECQHKPPQKSSTEDS